MSLKYLFGPVSAMFAEQNLKRQRAEGTCLAFNSYGDTDLLVRGNDTWADVRGRFPARWEPEAIVLYLPNATVAPVLRSAPLPRIGLTPDWRLLWHHYRWQIANCDRVLADLAGVEVMQRAGFEHAQFANLSGMERAFLEYEWPTGLRDIDVLFVGNVNRAVQRRRMPWLHTVARLGRRWRVRIQTGTFGDNYRRFLARSRIVVHFSPTGKCGRRAFEAAAAGALVFQEAGNRELPAYYRDRQECVYYRPEDLENLLDHFLVHEAERLHIAGAARAKAQECTFESLWAEEMRKIEADWPAIRDGVSRGVAVDPGVELVGRCWQALSALRWSDLNLLADLERASKDLVPAAPWHNALGVLFARQSFPEGHQTVPAREMAIKCFRRAVADVPTFALAMMNLAEAYQMAGQRGSASETAKQALELLDRQRPLDALSREGIPLCHGFETFRVEWEEAAWQNAGDQDAEGQAKAQVMRWRLQGMLSGLTGELIHHYEAVLVRPDLAATQVGLGEALIRNERPREARNHFEKAAAGNPLDLEAARGLWQTLVSVGDLEAQRRLAEERRLVAQAAPQLVPMEPWFAPPRESGRELASIIILCCNQLEYTQRCLESVIHCTRSPYEIVLVDNASSDGTAAYLEQFRSTRGPDRVVVIRNDENRGFAFGCNQGVAIARGRSIVFLNNDTIVTHGWLDGLIRWSLHEWPKTGLVGPMTNGAPAPQWTKPGYENLQDLNEFAAKRRREFSGRYAKVRRLTGFCLLARRELLDRVGPLDDRFGIGFFEDDDLCFRAIDAGFQLILAQDVYIHHFGSSTFKGLGLDTRSHLSDNFKIFQQKWGPEWTNGYRMPPQAIAAPAEFGEAAAPPLAAEPIALPQLKSSLCIIVKNEEKNLPDCLRTAQGLFDEIVVTDTGSTDGTREVAQKFGARIVEFPWVDSFASARNAGLEVARGKWIMWLDADDRLDEGNQRRVKQLFATLGDEMDAYAVKVRSSLDFERKSFRLLDQVRIFRNHPKIRWDYRIHEQILPAVNCQGGVVRWSDVIVDHTGYQDPTLRQGKLARNLRLLEFEVAEKPDDSFALFNLGWTLLDFGKYEESLEPTFEEPGARHAAIVDRAKTTSFIIALQSASRTNGRGARGMSPRTEAVS